MNELPDWMDGMEEVRHEKKVRRKLKDIIVIVLFAALANVDDWVEMSFLPITTRTLRNYIAGTACYFIISVLY